MYASVRTSPDAQSWITHGTRPFPSKAMSASGMDADILGGRRSVADEDQGLPSGPAAGAQRDGVVVVVAHRLRDVEHPLLAGLQVDLLELRAVDRDLQRLDPRGAVVDPDPVLLARD